MWVFEIHLFHVRQHVSASKTCVSKWPTTSRQTSAVLHHLRRRRQGVIMATGWWRGQRYGHCVSSEMVSTRRWTSAGQWVVECSVCGIRWAFHLTRCQPGTLTSRMCRNLEHTHLPCDTNRQPTLPANAAPNPMLEQHPMSVADPKILKKGGGGGRQCISPSSFIANAHNELHIYYICLLYGKMRLFDKKFYTNSGVGGTAASLSLINATLFYLKFAPPPRKKSTCDVAHCSSVPSFRLPLTVCIYSSC